VREGDDARMAVEIALLKAARPDLDPSTEGLLRRIERLEQQGTDASGPRVLSRGEGGLADSPQSPQSDAGDPPAGGADGGDPHSGGGREAASEHMGDPAAAGPAGQIDLDQIVRVWPSVLDQLLQTAPALAATFEGARPVAFDVEELTVTIGFPADHTFNKRKAEAPDKREQMAGALEAVLGQKLRPAYTVLDAEEAAPEAVAEDDDVDHAALVEKIKSEFDAEEVG
jgi:DNA polymerase-3 subunit gamma/tau